jgi:hypothetical protein
MLRLDAGTKLMVRWGRPENDMILGLEFPRESVPSLSTPNQLVGLRAHVKQEARVCLQSQAQEGSFPSFPTISMTRR